MNNHRGSPVGKGLGSIGSAADGPDSGNARVITDSGPEEAARKQLAPVRVRPTMTNCEIDEAQVELDELLECGDLEDQLDAAFRIQDLMEGK